MIPQRCYSKRFKMRRLTYAPSCTNMLSCLVGRVCTPDFPADWRRRWSNCTSQESWTGTLHALTCVILSVYRKMKHLNWSLRVEIQDQDRRSSPPQTHGLLGWSRTGWHHEESRGVLDISWGMVWAGYSLTGQTGSRRKLSSFHGTDHGG